VARRTVHFTPSAERKTDGFAHRIIGAEKRFTAESLLFPFVAAHSFPCGTRALRRKFVRDFLPRGAAWHFSAA
jgi:hypothetical protein